jgi:hypothetical protein
LYEEFGVATNIYLEAWLRHRKADALFKAYGTSHTLGAFPSWSEITVMGVLQKREHQLALSGPGGPYSAALIMGRWRTDPDAHRSANPWVHNCDATRVSARSETLYPGYEKYGHESLPGKVGKIRLGLTSAVRERLVQKILCMDGQPAE